MNLPEFLTFTVNLDPDVARRHTFISFKRALKVPERFYKMYQKKLLKRELCRETFSREAETIQEMSYDFFKENLSWVLTYVYYGQESIVEPERDIRDDFLQWTLMDYALLTGDTKSMALFVKYGIADKTFRSNPKRKSMDLYDIPTWIGRKLGPTDSVDDIEDGPTPAFKQFVANSKEFLRAKLEIFSFAIHARRSDLLPPFNPSAINVRTNINLLELFDEHGRITDYGNARGFRRFLLIAELLRAWTNSDRHFEDRKVCLKLYFRTIKDPFICREEFREFLSYFYKGIPEDSIKRITGDYESLFQDFAPRSLKHLCRCTVRSALAKKPGYLPDAVNSLQCPNPLKRYIYGQL